MRSVFLIFICIILRTSVSFGYSQNEKWTHFESVSGINDIVEHGKFIWICSNGGLIKFNKKTKEKKYFTKDNSKLPNNRVYSIVFENDGSKWIGTEAGLVHVQNGEWKVYTSDNSDLPGNLITALAIDKNNTLWVGVYFYSAVEIRDSLWVIHEKVDSRYLNFIKSITIDSKNNKWFSINNGVGLAKYDDSAWVVYHIDNSNLPEGHVQETVVDLDGNKWIATMGGVAKFDDSTWTVYDTSNSNLPDNDINSLSIDLDGGIWAGTENGLAYFDGTAWIKYDTLNSGIPDNSIYSILVDSKGTKWLGTWLNGVVEMSDLTIHTYNLFDSGLPSNYVADIAFDSLGNSWFATSNGLAKYDGTKWTIYRTSNSGISSNKIASLAIDKDNRKWIGTRGGGLAIFNDTTWTIYDSINSSIHTNTITAITFDCKGVAWIGSWRAEREYYRETGALSSFDGSNWVSFTKKNSGIIYYRITTIRIDNNDNKWLGTHPVERFDVWGGLGLYNDTGFTMFKRYSNSMPSNVVSSIEIDKYSNVWIGARCWYKEDKGGLVKYDGIKWTVYDSSNSILPENNIISLSIDSEDVKWVGMYKSGIAKFDNEKWTLFNSSNSELPSDYVKKIVINPSNEKWISHIKGISVFQELSETKILAQKNSTFRSTLKVIQKANEINVTYSISKPSAVSLLLYDIKGRVIKAINKDYSASGNYTENLRIKDSASGAILLKLKTDDCSITKKIFNIK